MWRALEFFVLYPADRFVGWSTIAERIAVSLSGGLLLAPFINRLECLRAFYAWLRAHPVRFRLWLLFGWWPMCNVRRLLLALARGRPACLHVSLARHGAPTVRLSREVPARPADRTRLVVVSDTHGLHGLLTIPPCDVLVHCGDLMCEDRGIRARDGGAAALARLRSIGEWLGAQPCADAVVIGGNHDAILEDLGAAAVQAALSAGAARAPTHTRAPARVRYLCDEAAEVRALRLWATPLNAANSAASQNTAFQPPYGTPDDGAHAKVRAALAVPAGSRVAVLVSHGPPRGALCGGVGLESLRALVARERPRLHLFGHQHLAYGVAYEPRLGTTFVNAASCDGFFSPLHPPVVIDLDAREGAQGCREGREGERVGGEDGAVDGSEGGLGFQLSATTATWLNHSPWTLGLRREPFSLPGLG
jgi:predicted phosphodiesterase